MRRFLGEEATGQPQKEKLVRRATKTLLQALDHALKLVTGKGLEQAIGPHTWEKKAPEGPEGHGSQM